MPLCPYEGEKTNTTAIAALKSNIAAKPQQTTQQLSHGKGMCFYTGGCPDQRRKSVCPLTSKVQAQLGRVSGEAAAFRGGSISLHALVLGICALMDGLQLQYRWTSVTLKAIL